MDFLRFPYVDVCVDSCSVVVGVDRELLDVPAISVRALCTSFCDDKRGSISCSVFSPPILSLSPPSPSPPFVLVFSSSHQICEVPTHQAESQLLTVPRSLVRMQVFDLPTCTYSRLIDKLRDCSAFCALVST